MLSKNSARVLTPAFPSELTPGPSLKTRGEPVYGRCVPLRVRGVSEIMNGNAQKFGLASIVNPGVKPALSARGRGPARFFRRSPQHPVRIREEVRQRETVGTDPLVPGEIDGGVHARAFRQRGIEGAGVLAPAESL